MTTKWICIAIGSLLGLIGELASPWPQFVMDLSEKMLVNPVVAKDIVLPTLVRVSTPVIAYVLFPVFGGGLGHIAGYLLERRFQ